MFYCHGTVKASGRTNLNSIIINARVNDKKNYFNEILKTVNNQFNTRRAHKLETNIT